MSQKVRYILPISGKGFWRPYEKFRILRWGEHPELSVSQCDQKFFIRGWQEGHSQRKRNNYRSRALGDKGLWAKDWKGHRILKNGNLLLEHPEVI